MSHRLTGLWIENWPLLWRRQLCGETHLDQLTSILFEMSTATCDQVHHYDDFKNQSAAAVIAIGRIEQEMGASPMKFNRLEHVICRLGNISSPQLLLPSFDPVSLHFCLSPFLTSLIIPDKFITFTCLLERISNHESSHFCQSRSVGSKICGQPP